ncbi:alpha/beta hydrolase [Prosthecobacter sp.]|uniref:alpha/beta hydrolase n=1 Tax=Prosthecobacter sp. TaxID=1965333 RepID=UPI00248A83FE|nr:alpha/beta hydrolase [Prosthecobacter sp.]MDI1312790.1 alpha/beta hydrolase [Prosthecobacter sp.]
MKSLTLLFPIFLLASHSSLSAAEKPLVLWPMGAPGALGTTPKDIPTLTPYVPEKASGAAMLLIPGGSYSGIYEGQAEPFARWLNEQGITAFVLRYRLGSAGYRYPALLQDAVESMRQIRANAARWKIDPARIGVMGFSAGGHLVSTLLNRPEDGEIAGREPTVSPRPDLAILCYPVISMITKPHATSRKMLIGDKPDDELVRKTSSELQVHSGLPPCFLWHTCEDKLVPVEHAQLYAAALHQNDIPHELHLYQHGDHGTGLIGTQHPWFADLVFWLKAQKWTTER